MRLKAGSIIQAEGGLLRQHSKGHLLRSEGGRKVRVIVKLEAAQLIPGPL